MNSFEKVLKIEALSKKILKHKKAGKKIAFTNGCFDIIHLGHVSYLEKAKEGNRILIVGLNSDKSIQRIKGKTRPIISQKERAGVLAALTCVDYIVIFNEDTPYETIKKLQPDILIKGADWKGKETVGSDIVKANGGRIEYIKYISGISTTNIIKKIIEKCEK